MEARRHKLLDLRASLKGHNTLKKSNLITSAVNQTCHYFRFYKKTTYRKVRVKTFEVHSRESTIKLYDFINHSRCCGEILSHSPLQHYFSSFRFVCILLCALNVLLHHFSQVNFWNLIGLLWLCLGSVLCLMTQFVPTLDVREMPLWSL